MEDLDKLKILIVDDETDVLKVLKERLEVAGMKRIATAQSREKAEKKTREEHFDVIIADMYMEEENSGYLLTERFSDLSPLVIVITGYKNEREFRKFLADSLRAGAYACVDKTEEDACDQVVRAIQEGIKGLKSKNVHVHRDSKYISDNFNELVKQYPGQYVAVLDERVVGVGTDYDELAREMVDTYPFVRITIASVPGEERRVG